MARNFLWFAKLVAGAYQGNLAPSYIEAASFDVTDFQLKLVVFGTTLLGKVWTTGTAEPDHWMIKATDSSYSSGAGGVMIATDPTLGLDIVQAAFDDVSLSTPSEVWVDDGWATNSAGDVVDGHTFGYDAFAKVQDGIDNVSGITVNVAAARYGDCLNIDTKSNLHVVGADKTTTTIKPNCTLGWNVGGYGTSRQGGSASRQLHWHRVQQLYL